MTPETLAEVEKALEKTTHGPWEIHETDGEVRIENVEGSCVSRVFMGHDFPYMDDQEAAEADADGRNDARFIANARQWVPELAAYVRELHEEALRAHRLAHMRTASAVYEAQMAEREECAKIADDYFAGVGLDSGNESEKAARHKMGERFAAETIASAIRARKP